MHEDQAPKTVGEPVPGFPIKFEWQTNKWLALFDAQVQQIQEDIARARADDRSVIYLSCPISNRGGGFSGANIDIAKFTQHRLMNELGGRFWILNPTQYQMQSKEGTGLIYRHARNLNFPKELVDALPPPSGGDYMRMWTRVLVEDDEDNLGARLDAYYFLGPEDTVAFFSQGGAATTTSGIEEYFARKHSTDPDFRAYFSPKSDTWEQLRKEFVRFYSLRAGAVFSKGCHDEWNILVLLNRLRLKNQGIGSQLGVFFDGKQVPPGATESGVFPGYAVP